MDKTRVIKKLKSFILGKCWCGCGVDVLPLRSKSHKCLRKYSKGHSERTDLHKFNETKLCECGCGTTIKRCLPNGIELRFMKGHGFKKENHPNWKGGRYLSTDGYCYVLARGHPFATKQGYIREHRLVMEKKISRYLRQGEEVHHINGNTQNNKIENLHLYLKGDHSRLTNIKDLSGYSCFLCMSKETYIRKHNNRPHWFKYGENKDKRICHKCYNNNYHKKP